MSGSTHHHGALFDAAAAEKEQQAYVNRVVDELDRALGMAGLPPVDRRGNPVVEVARILTEILHLINNTRRLEH